jgi:hypothetical protein
MMYYRLEESLYKGSRLLELYQTTTLNSSAQHFVQPSLSWSTDTFGRARETFEQERAWESEVALPIWMSSSASKVSWLK